MSLFWLNQVVESKEKSKAASVSFVYFWGFEQRPLAHPMWLHKWIFGGVTGAAKVFRCNPFALYFSGYKLAHDIPPPPLPPLFLLLFRAAWGKHFSFEAKFCKQDKVTQDRYNSWSHKCFYTQQKWWCRGILLLHVISVSDILENTGAERPSVFPKHLSVFKERSSTFVFFPNLFITNLDLFFIVLDITYISYDKRLIIEIYAKCVFMHFKFPGINLIIIYIIMKEMTAKREYCIWDQILINPSTRTP